MTIQERYEEYKSKYEKLKSEKDKQWEEHMKYCELNKFSFPRPTYRDFFFMGEYEMTMNYHKMKALEEFI